MNATITMVKLSYDRSIAEDFRTASAILPVIWCIVGDFLIAPLPFVSFLSDYFKAVYIADHDESITFTDVSRSNIPSQPSTMKSAMFSSMVNYEISGTALTTPGLPPNLTNLASISPKVRETLKRPGKTR